MYNRALSANEIKTLYQGNLAKTSATTWNFVYQTQDYVNGNNYYTGQIRDAVGYSAQTGQTIIIDNQAPTITINNPGTARATSKTITAGTSDGTLYMSSNTTTNATCDNSVAFTTYGSITFSSETDNGKYVCYKAVDALGNTSYLVSSPISNIDRTAPAATTLTFPTNSIYLS